MTIFMHQQIRIYNIITINCTKSEIGYELAHLFKGCRDECCVHDNSQYYHDPTLVMKATTDLEPSNGTTIDIYIYIATPRMSNHKGSIIASAALLSLITIIIIITVVCVLIILFI